MNSGLKSVFQTLRRPAVRHSARGQIVRAIRRLEQFCLFKGNAHIANEHRVRKERCGARWQAPAKTR